MRWPGRTTRSPHLADVAGEEDRAEMHLVLEGLEAAGKGQRLPRVLAGLWGAKVWGGGGTPGMLRGAPPNPPAALTEER